MKTLKTRTVYLELDPNKNLFTIWVYIISIVILLI